MSHTQGRMQEAATAANAAPQNLTLISRVQAFASKKTVNKILKLDQK